MGTPKILIVDDDPDLLDTVVMILKSGGVKADYTKAGGGEEALQILQDKEYDLVVLDKQMPKVDGFEVLDFIREKQPRTIVIMLTQITEPYLVSLIEMKGAFYVPKPPHNKAFVMLVKRELSRQKGFEF